MKHLYKITLLLLLALLMPATAIAYDFYVNGIYYNINGTEATVTYQSYSNGIYINDYSGDVTIPTTVIYGGVTYPVTSIGARAFSNCFGLTSIAIPSSVTRISGEVFPYCSNLTSISVNPENTVYDSRDNCNAIIRKSTNDLVVGCKSTVIPSSVTGISEGAFYACTGLTSIAIPTSVSWIGDYAFGDCDSLSSVFITGEGDWQAYNLPEGIKTLYIGKGVTAVKRIRVNPEKIYSYATTPPVCDENSFTGYDAELHVPASSMAAYFTAPYWCNFTNIIGDAVILTDLTLDRDSIEVLEGNHATLKATVTPAGAVPNDVSWISSNNAIATVENGVITAVKDGECDIIATCQDKRAICHLTVVKNSIYISLDQHEISILPNHMVTITPTTTQPTVWGQAVVTFIPGETYGNNETAQGADSMQKDGITISTTSGGLKAAQYRFAKGSVTTVSSTIGNITSIELFCVGSGTEKYGPGCFAAQAGYSYEGNVGTWVGSSTSVDFTAETNQVRATKIIVTVECCGISKPIINPADGTYYSPIQVTITCGTSGAKIYYTTNGSNPTTSSTQYSAPFTLNSNTTVKAISAKDGEVSEVVEATYEFATAVGVPNIGAFQNTADGTVVKFNNPVNVLAQNKKYLYVMDNTGYAFFFGETGQTYKNGDVIPAGFAGTKTTYAGEPELQVATGFQPASGNSPIAPEEISANQVGHNMFAHYVKMDNVTIVKVDDRNYELTDANGNTCAIYFGSMGVSAPSDLDVTYDVIGIVGSYGMTNTVYQILPISFSLSKMASSTKSMVTTDIVVTSSDPSVVAVRLANDKIQVMGVKEGTATIIVSSRDGYAIPDSCVVTVYTERGDVNCDGFVNISDATSLIDALLDGGNVYSTENADCNNDGKVNITDLTRLIDALLGGTVLPEKERTMALASPEEMPKPSVPIAITHWQARCFE